MNKLSNNGISGIESFVLFQNSQGENGRGTLIHLTRNNVVFETYNPYSIVQLSEVLKDLQIFRGERAIYSGKAIVSNLVPTGLMLIVSASLIDPWSDLGELVPGRGLRQELDLFVKQWNDRPELSPAYQLAVNKLRTFLAEMSRLLEQVDVATESRLLEEAKDKYKELFDEILTPILPKMEELFFSFENEAKKIPQEHVWAHKAFVRQELHPLFLCSPYIHRIYTKPLGYAGDYEMVNMMWRDPFEGPNTYAKLMNFICLKMEAVEAHKNRIKILKEKINDEAIKSARQGKALRVMNIGCGPAIEIQQFIKQNGLSYRCEFHLIDFNTETITYIRNRIQDILQNDIHKMKFEFINKSIHQILKETVREPLESLNSSFDIVYCAGLFDYLSDRICERLLKLFYKWLTPEGVLIATNVHPKNPIRYFMEHLAEWHLIYREESNFAKLSPNKNLHKIYTDSTGLNVFLEVPGEARQLHCRKT